MVHLSIFQRIQNALWNDVRSFAVQDSKLSFVMSDGSLASLVDSENFNRKEAKKICIDLIKNYFPKQFKEY